MSLSDTTPPPGDRNDMPFWGRVATSPSYRRFSDAMLSSPGRQFAMLAVIPILWVLLTHLGPLLQMFRVSLLDAYPPTRDIAPQFTTEHYGLFFKDQLFFAPFMRTLVFSLSLTLITLVVVYPVAYFLARHVKRNNQLLFLMLLLIPFWAGEIIRSYAMMLMLGNNGAINLALRAVGLIDRPIPFMYTNFAVSFAIIYLTALYMLLPLYSALEKIPQSFSEAAADLGAGPLKRFWRVTLPLSLDGVASGCTLVFLISTGIYAVPVLFGGPSTTTFAETIAGFFHVAGDRWPTGAAFSIIMLITALTITMVFNRLIKMLQKEKHR
ncbi:ABC transporter permease [Oceaniglobus ichthyenteri]|uniref:ABC transporter permease n=1 Tax=Oceaniglobus ichthyenteri TaxID=2136177 RepID=UPI000D3CBFDB|nr:ABC transporter permease [Oceaniglobus ichthyenteri]